MNDFRDENLAIEERVDALLGELTIDEKLGFINYCNEGVPRLGINPYVWWNEALHGLARSGSATVFPQAIAMAATFDDSLVQKMGEVISKEGRARHFAAAKHNDFGTYKGLTYWSPNVNIFRDPRWGRGQETYGECPYLTSKFGVAYVKGVQGDNVEKLNAVATPKHFAVHSGPERTRLSFDSVVDEKDLRETYLVAFKACIDAGAQSIMSAYNAINGTPCSTNSYLLKDILRKEWGFDGAVVTDAGTGVALVDEHKRVEDYPKAIEVELKNGVDVITDMSIAGAREAFKRGLIDENDINQALRNQFRVKFRMGLFDTPKNIPSYDVIECQEHLDLALQASQKSIVLLKNENNVLPLDQDSLKSIAVIGPNADLFSTLVGNYYGTPTQYSTYLKGVIDAVGDKCRVYYAKGCEPRKLRTEVCAEDYDRIAEAISVAEHADAVILFMGLNPQLEGEAGDVFNAEAAGDKGDLLLPGLQNLVVDKVVEAAKGKPVILVSVSGSALALPVEKFDGVIQAFYAGAQGGDAVADVLFGKISPSGKLPVTIYKSVDDLPDFNDYSMANRTYRFFAGDVLYPFGYGLTYSNFGIKDINVPAQNSIKEKLLISLTIENLGSMEADEVVQVYVSCEDAPTRMPIKQLASFKRVTLAPNMSQKLDLIIDPESFLATYDDGKRSTVKGLWKIGVGLNSKDLEYKQITLV